MDCSPLSRGFSRQEYCSGLPCPPPSDFSIPGIKPRSSALQADSLPSEPQGSPKSKTHMLSCLKHDGEPKVVTPMWSGYKLIKIQVLNFLYHSLWNTFKETTKCLHWPLKDTHPLYYPYEKEIIYLNAVGCRSKYIGLEITKAGLKSCLIWQLTGKVWLPVHLHPGGEMLDPMFPMVLLSPEPPNYLSFHCVLSNLFSIWQPFQIKFPA